MKDQEWQRIFRLPFKEAENFLKAKLNIPTAKWDDLWQAEHAKGFMSAGAMRADLLADLRQMVDKAVGGGKTLKEFRQEFPALVERYGWQLQGGGPGWRADLIWRTNIRTAYQAGRWQQFAEAGIEWLKYVHNDSVVHPRPAHVAMDGMVAKRDSAFWASNYPPNGFGCKCRAVPAYQDEIPLDGRSPKPSEAQIPDVGWAYNVGQAGEEAGYRALTAKFEMLPNDIARAWVARFVGEPAYERFIAGKIKGEFPVAVIKSADMAALGAINQTVWLSAETLADHLSKHPEIGLADYRLLPEIIDKGEVYLQKEGRLVILALKERVYRLALKTTGAKDRNYVLTIFSTSEESNEREIIRKFEKIR
ncbi:MAG: minor capsid protein [Desulfobulbaceae bacterium]|jgi:SPP1 gp7 family putative phage head morphogenesis protein|nr:minor capsid protein [Desulfobulbaceae bacterium]